MPDLSDIIDDDLKEKNKTFLWLSTKAWERISLAVIMIIGGLILEQGRVNSKRLDAIESKVGTDSKQWERINKISAEANNNKVLITQTAGHHAVIDRDIDSMWLALKAVDIETAKLAIQSGVNKELLRLVIEEDILKDDCEKCREYAMPTEVTIDQSDDFKLPRPSPPPSSPPPRPVQIQIDALNALDERVKQIPEEIDHYKMRQMKR